MRFIRAILMCVVGGVVAACAQSAVESAGTDRTTGGVPQAAASDAAIVAPSAATARLDARRWLAAPVVSVNLTVWPVITDAPRVLGEVLTLDEALSRGVAKVTEVGGAGAQSAQSEQIVVQSAPPLPRLPRAREIGAPLDGRVTQTVAGRQSTDGGLEFQVGAEVNALVIENAGDAPILICGGTIVRGGNQDRQIGEDVVVAAHSTRRVEVFCVEQGRWNSDRWGVSTNSLFGAAGAVTSNSVRLSAQYLKSQGEVWKQVEKVPSFDVQIAQAAEVGGRTSYLRNLENASSETAEARAKTASAVRAHFGALRGAGSHVVGFAYAVNGRPVNVRTFAAPRVFAGQFEPFLQAMIIDAEAVRAAGPGPGARAEDVVALVEQIRRGVATDESRAGYKLRIVKGDAGFNSNCYAVRDAAAPMTAFPGEDVPLTEDWTSK